MRAPSLMAIQALPAIVQGGRPVFTALELATADELRELGGVGQTPVVHTGETTIG